MAMPIDLVLVRHGESEGNVANRLSRTGDHSAFTADFRARHSSEWRLSKKGQTQAKAAAEWLSHNLDLPFDRHYVSTFIRAKETAGLLDLPDAEWYAELHLRERDWGQLDVMPQDERHSKFTEVEQKRKINSFYWKPPDGESIADVDLRLRSILNTLHRETSEKRVIMVVHGELMWALRYRLERMSIDEWIQLDNSKDPKDEIHNCQIIQYSRKHPKTGEILTHYNYMRSVCPWDTSLSSNDWQPVDRQLLSNSDLLSEAGSIQRLVNNVD